MYLNINNKTEKTKGTCGFPIFWKDKLSFFKGFNEKRKDHTTIVTGIAIFKVLHIN